MKYIIFLNLLVLTSCQYFTSNSSNETVDVEHQDTMPSITIIETDDLAILSAYDNEPFEEVETGEPLIIERLNALLGDDAADVLSPIYAGGMPCDLVDENTLMVTGEITHEGYPYLSIVVFDMYNDNIFAALYQSDSKTLKTFAEENVNVPKVYRTWVADYQ